VSLKSRRIVVERSEVILDAVVRDRKRQAGDGLTADFAVTKTACGTDFIVSVGYQRRVNSAGIKPERPARN
jgi:hypothetical protein